MCALPAWLLGHDPTLAIVNATYAQDLSEKFARDCRAVMASDWYQALFPTRLASPREPLAELATTCGGFRMATSVGGVLTGRGADMILIDDPLKPIDAMSQSRRAAANDWFDRIVQSWGTANFVNARARTTGHLFQGRLVRDGRRPFPRSAAHSRVQSGSRPAGRVS